MSSSFVVRNTPACQRPFSKRPRTPASNVLATTCSSGGSDRNAFGREEDKSFWVKGGSRAEFLIKADKPFRRLTLMLSAGPVGTNVEASVSGRSQQIALAAGGSQQIQFSLGEGYPYQGRWVWTASVSSSNGFVPLFYEPSADSRYLGVRVKPMVVP